MRTHNQNPGKLRSRSVRELRIVHHVNLAANPLLARCLLASPANSSPPSQDVGRFGEQFAALRFTTDLATTISPATYDFASSRPHHD